MIENRLRLKALFWAMVLMAAIFQDASAGVSFATHRSTLGNFNSHPSIDRVWIPYSAADEAIVEFSGGKEKSIDLKAVAPFISWVFGDVRIITLDLHNDGSDEMLVWDHITNKLHYFQFSFADSRDEDTSFFSGFEDSDVPRVTYLFARDQQFLGLPEPFADYLIHIGKFGPDGVLDLVLQSQTRDELYLSEGFETGHNRVIPINKYINGTPIVLPLAADTTIVSVGDFNGDYFDDLLVNQIGLEDQHAIWLMQGPEPIIEIAMTDTTLGITLNADRAKVGGITLNADNLLDFAIQVAMGPPEDPYADFRLYFFASQWTLNEFGVGTYSLKQCDYVYFPRAGSLLPDCRDFAMVSSKGLVTSNPLLLALDKNDRFNVNQCVLNADGVCGVYIFAALLANTTATVCIYSGSVSPGNQIACGAWPLGSDDRPDFNSVTQTPIGIIMTTDKPMHMQLKAIQVVGTQDPDNPLVPPKPAQPFFEGDIEFSGNNFTSFTGAFRVCFRDVSGIVDRYELSRELDGQTTIISTIAGAGSSFPSCRQQNIQPQTSLISATYTVTAINSTGQTSSAPHTILIEQPNVDIGAPSAVGYENFLRVEHPTNETTVYFDDEQGIYDVIWNSVAGAVDYIVCEYPSGSGCNPIGVVQNTRVTIVRPAQTEEQGFRYGVRAVGDGGTAGAETVGDLIKIPAASVALPSAPLRLTTTPLTTRIVVANWSPPANGNVLEYRFERSRQNQLPNPSWTDWAETSKVSGTGFEFAESTSGFYRYRVRACGTAVAGSCGQYSNISDTEVNNTPPRPASRRHSTFHRVHRPPTCCPGARPLRL